MSSFTRTILFEGHDDLSAYYKRSHGDASLIAYKAMLRRTGKYLDVKVGVIGSGSTITQQAEGVASFAIPGDLSGIRSPVRSRVYSALTPGGGTRLRVPGTGAKPTRGYRCQEGFQFGGRFTDSQYSTCGQMLFDIFGLGTGLAALGTVGNLKKPSALRATPETSVISGEQIPGESQLISRAAQIPRVGNLDKSKLSENVGSAAKELVGAKEGSSAIVRRDGFMLKPVVSAAILRTVPDNRNMEGATYLTAVSQATNIGGQELGLLSNTGIDKVQYVLPSGVTLSLEKKRALTVGERRKLGRTVNDVTSIDVSNDPTARLKAVAEQSGGGIVYSENLDAIPKANDLVSVGKGKSTRRWIAESFKKPAVQKASVQPETVSEDRSKLSSKISSLTEAVKHLDANGDPTEIDPDILSQAMLKTKSFTTTKLPDGSSFHQRADGNAFYEVSSKGQFEHLGSRVASDVQAQLGLKSPKVSFLGSGNRRSYLIDDPRNVVSDTALNSSDDLSKVRPNDIIAIAVSDWLLDERSRTPGNIIPFKIEAGDGAIASSNRTSGLVDLSKSQISERQKLNLEEYFADSGKGAYGSNISELVEAQRRLIANQLDKIIERALAFNWDEYTSRLALDGKLSASEKTHLELIKSLYTNRLNILKTSKTSFLKYIGLT